MSIATVYNSGLTLPRGENQQNSGFGFAVSINNSGTIVAVSSILANDNQGQVNIYQRNRTMNRWDLKGSPITVSTTSHLQSLNAASHSTTKYTMGWSIKLSGDGEKIAIGIPGVNNPTEDAIPGYCQVYSFNNTSSAWELLGDTKTGLANQDWFGISVSLSGETTNRRILCVGSSRSNTSTTGAVALYKQNFDSENSTSTWDLLGRIPGFYSDDYFGRFLDMNYEGTLIAAGAPSSNTSYINLMRSSDFSCEGHFLFHADHGVLSFQSLRGSSYTGATQGNQDSNVTLTTSGVYHAAVFGGDNYLNLGSTSNVLFGEGDWTMTTWFQTSQTGSVGTLMFFKNSDLDDGFRVTVDSSGFLNVWGSTSSNVINGNTWNCLSLKSDGDVQLYRTSDNSIVSLTSESTYVAPLFEYAYFGASYGNGGSFDYYANRLPLTLTNGSGLARYNTADGRDSGNPGTFHSVVSGSGISESYVADRECLLFTGSGCFDLTTYVRNVQIVGPNTTFSFWVHSNGLTTGTHSVFAIHDADTSPVDRFLISCDFSGGSFELKIKLSENGANPGSHNDLIDETVSDLDLNRWYHIVVVIAESPSYVCKLYIDGTEVSDMTPTSTGIYPSFLNNNITGLYTTADGTDVSDSYQDAVTSNLTEATVDSRTGILLDGSNSLNVSDAFNPIPLNSTQGFSISFWFHPNTTNIGSGKYFLEMSKNTITNAARLEFRSASSTTMTIQMRQGGINETFSINPTGWNHVVFVYDEQAAFQKIYWNNTLAAENNATDVAVSLDSFSYTIVKIGCDDRDANHMKAGVIISDFLFSNKVFTSSEVTELYNYDYRVGVPGNTLNHTIFDTYSTTNHTAYLTLIDGENTLAHYKLGNGEDNSGNDRDAASDPELSVSHFNGREAIYFTGNKKMDLTSHVSSFTVSDFSMSMWIHDNGSSNSGYAFDMSPTAGTADVFQLYFRLNEPDFTLYLTKDGVTEISGYHNITTGQWNHIVVVISQGPPYRLELWLNNVQVSIGTPVTSFDLSQIAADITSMAIGAQANASTNYLNDVYMADFLFFNKALSIAEIGYLYNSHTTEADLALLGASASDGSTKENYFAGALSDFCIFNYGLTSSQVKNVYHTGYGHTVAYSSLISEANVVRFVTADGSDSGTPGTFDSTVTNISGEESVELITLDGRTGISFNNNYFDLSSYASNNSLVGNNMTFAFWFHSNGITTGQHDLINIRGNESDPTIDGFFVRFSFSTDPITLRLYLSDNEGGESTNFAIEMTNYQTGLTHNTWHHLAIVIGDTPSYQVKIYLNGALARDETSNVSGTPTIGSVFGSTASSYWIGVTNDGTGSTTKPFNGLVTDINIFNTVLELSDIQALANDTISFASGSVAGPDNYYVGNLGQVSFYHSLLSDVELQTIFRKRSPGSSTLIKKQLHTSDIFPSGGSYSGFNIGAGDVSIAGTELNENAVIGFADPYYENSFGAVTLLSIEPVGFEWYGNSWAQMLLDTVDGEENTYFGTSIDFSKDTKYLAVGSTETDIITENFGFVRIYKYNATDTEYQPLAEDIIGEDLGGEYGKSVAINGTGSKFIAGANHVSSVFHWSSGLWMQNIHDISNICFMPGTMVTIDSIQGINTNKIPIEKLSKKEMGDAVYTIMGRRVIGISRTFQTHKHVIRIQKGSLGLTSIVDAAGLARPTRVPYVDVYLSQNHIVQYKDRFLPAYALFRQKIPGVSQIEYNHLCTPLYNVLLEGNENGTMIVEGVTTETLHFNSREAEVVRNSETREKRGNKKTSFQKK